MSMDASSWWLRDALFSRASPRSTVGAPDGHTCQRCLVGHRPESRLPVRGGGVRSRIGPRRGMGAHLYLVGSSGTWRPEAHYRTLDLCLRGGEGCEDHPGGG